MKKLFAVLWSLSLLWGSLPALAAGGSGTPDWAAGSYDYLKENQVYPPETSGSISRQFFLDLLLSTLNAALPDGALDAVERKPEGYFADAPGTQHWTDRMLLAAGCGITEGSVDSATGLRYGNFDATITRAEAAKMLCAALDFCAGEGYEAAASGQSTVYSDADAIPAWAAPYAGRVAAYGLMKGDQAQRFLPTGELDWPSAVVMAARVLALVKPEVDASLPGVELHSALDWAGALNVTDSSVAQPLTGYGKGYYTVSNGDGTLSAVVVPAKKEGYVMIDNIATVVPAEEFFVERYDAQGNVTDTRTLPIELPIFGGFFDSGEHFYLAFGQANQDRDDSREVWRIVQYDRNWNRLGAVSVSGGDSYTTQPFRSTVSRMTVSGDGQTLVLYAARTRYDGHQSNITFLMNTKPFSIQKVMGEEFPSNHVSHSFGQFVRYDGGELVTVDHGDAYPRSFVLQREGRSLDLLKIAGNVGDNVTHAIGSGFEVSGSGYLFLGCSTAQKDFSAEDKAPRQVFLAYADKGLEKAELTWLTSGTQGVDAARLVKLSEDKLLVMWGSGDGVHYLTVDGKGKAACEEKVLKGAAMPTAEPVVEGGRVLWIGVSSDRTAIYSIEP